MSAETIITRIRNRFAGLPRAARISIVLLPVLLVALLAGSLRGSPVAAERVTRQDVLQTVVTTGRVSTLAKVDIASQTIGNVAAVLVEAGDAVKEGQVLLRLRDQEAKASLAQAEALLREAELRVQQMKDVDGPSAAMALKQAEANARNARSTFERYQSLHQKGYLSRAELDEAQRALAVAEGQEERDRLNRTSVQPGGSSYQQAEARLAQAKAAVVAARERLGYLSVISPGPGRIINRSVEAGDVVQPGKTLMTMARTGRIQVIAQVDERNLGLLREGQEANGSADAYPDRTFRARLATLVPAVDPLRGTVEVRFDVLDPPSYLLPDMTVSLEVQAARKNGILTLPAGSVRESTAGPWVLVIRNGKAAHQSVSLGSRSNGIVEVTAGLAEGELVVPLSELRVREGQHVRPRGAGGN